MDCMAVFFIDIGEIGTEIEWVIFFIAKIESFDNNRDGELQFFDDHFNIRVLFINGFQVGIHLNKVLLEPFDDFFFHRLFFIFILEHFF